MNIRAPAEEKDAQYTAEKGGDECGLFRLLLDRHRDRLALTRSNPGLRLSPNSRSSHPNSTHGAGGVTCAHMAKSRASIKAS